MKMPELEVGPVESAVKTAAAPFDAARGLAGVVEEGLLRYTQELVRTQKQKADTRLAERLNEIDTDLSSRPYVSAEEVREVLGGNEDQLPPHVRQQLYIRDQKGELIDNPQIPTWAVFGPLYDKRAQQAVDEASSEISMPGWQTAFRDDSRSSVVARKARLNQAQVTASVQYLKSTQLSNIGSMQNAARTPEEFARVRAEVMASTVFEPAEKEKLLGAAKEAEQLRPVLDAGMSDDPAQLRAQVTRLRAGGQDVDQIDPQHRAQYVRSMEAQLNALEHEQKNEVDKLLKENAERSWNNIFSASDSARRAGRQLTSREYNQLIPKPGTVPVGDWDRMNDMLEGLTKPKKPEPVKTDYATYWNVTQSLMRDPEAFKQGMVTVSDENGNPRQVSLFKLSDRLSEADFTKFVDQMHSLKTDPYVYHGAVTDQEAINSVLSSAEYGYDMKTKDVDQLRQIGHITSLVNNTIAVRSRNKGSALTAQERDATIREVVRRDLPMVKSESMWRFLPWAPDKTRKLVTLGVAPEVAVALYEGTAAGGRQMTPEDVVKAAEDYSTYEPGITSAWGVYGKGKPLSPESSVGIYFLVDRNRAQIDAELRRAGKLTGDDVKDNQLRAALATRAYLRGGM